ncbi:unnamed protein product, partial [Prorocentrum cordatum]
VVALFAFCLHLCGLSAQGVGEEAIGVQCATVHSQADAVMWVEHGLSVLRARGIPDFHVESQIDALTYSTAFSGIDAPGTALAFLSSAFNIDTAKHLWAVEADQECQREHRLHPHAPEHIMPDMLSAVTTSVRGLVDQHSGRVPLIALTDALKTGRMARQAAQCILHPGRSCLYCKAHVHIAGTPCIDFSADGKRKLLSGDCLAPLIAWLAQRLTWVLNKGCYRTPLMKWPEAVPLFERECMLSYRDFLVVSEEEIHDLLKWKRNWKSKMRMTSKSSTNDDLPKECLARYEIEFLVAGVQKLGCHGVVSLTQSPCLNVISKAGEMFTLTTKNFLNWIIERSRPMTAEEMLAFQGFP